MDKSCTLTDMELEALGQFEERLGPGERVVQREASTPLLAP